MISQRMAKLDKQKLIIYVSICPIILYPLAQSLYEFKIAQTSSKLSQKNINKDSKENTTLKLSQPNNNYNPNNKITITAVGWDKVMPGNTKHHHHPPQTQIYMIEQK